MGLIKWHISKSYDETIAALAHETLLPIPVSSKITICATVSNGDNHAAAGYNLGSEKRVRMKRRSSRPNPCSTRGARLGFLGSTACPILKSVLINTAFATAALPPYNGILVTDS